MNLEAPSNPSRTRNYLLGLGSGYVFTTATVVVGLWLTPFTLRFLDREQFAVFTLASDVLMWLTLLDFGISSALRIQAAQLTGRPDHERLNRLASTAFFAESAVVFLFLICGVGLAHFFPRFFSVRPDLQSDATMLVLLLLAGAAMSLGTQVFSALLVAHQQIHVDNTINLLNLATRTVLTVVLLKAGWGLYSLGVANLVAKATTSLFAVFRTYRLLPALQIKRRHVSWNVLRGSGAIGLWFTLGGLAGIVIVSLDRVIVGRLFSLEMVTTLSLTGRLYALASSLIEPVTNTARPMLAQLIGAGKTEGIATVYHQLSVLSTGFAVVAAASIWAGNRAFVTRWVGGENYGGWLLDAAFALRLVGNSWVLPNRALLTAKLLVRPQVKCRLVEGAAAFCGAVVLASYAGATGVVLGMLLGGLITSVWYLPLLVARSCEWPLATLLRGNGRLLMMLGVMAIVAWGIRTVAEGISGFYGAALNGTLAAVCGVGLLWFLVFDDDIRQRSMKTFARVYAFCGLAPSTRAN